MNQKRYNIFNQIHKALRGFLYDTAHQIQITDFDRPAAEQTIENVLLVVELFDEHAQHEDSYLLPMLLKHDAQMVENFEKDHILDHKLSEDLRNLCNSWITADKEDRNEIGQRLFYAFNEFIAFNLYHMNREEHELLSMLWQYYSDADLLSAQRSIIQSIDEGALMLQSKWMMKNLNDGEISLWLSNIKSTAPTEAYQFYEKLAEETLTENRWKGISARIGMR